MLSNRCRICDEEKPIKDFSKDRSKKSDHRNECKKCAKLIQHEKYMKNREIRLGKQKEYNLENKTKIREYLKTYSKSYYRENREKILMQTNKYKHENKEHINKMQREYYNQNINYRIKSIMWRMITMKIKYKTKKMIALLGCTIKEFKEHFESLFTVGMTWEKFMNGEIHIDHILPCSAFELQNSEEQEICFHYTNLQPLWAKDNISKGKKILVGGSI